VRGGSFMSYPAPGALPHTSQRPALLQVSLPRLGLLVLGSLLALITIVQFVLSAAVILQPREVLYGEAMVYDHAARLLRGEPLYQPLDRPPYTVAAYTPLYYWLAAGLQAVFGPGFGPGRGLSFAAGLAAASLVARITALRARDRWAGAFAALLFLALGLPWLYLWSALYRVDLLGVALSLGAVATLVGGTTPRRLVLAGLLAALAILTKQTFIAAGLAGTIWLWRGDRKKAAVFASTCLTIVLGTCLVMEMTTGAFIANSIFANANPFLLSALLDNVGIFVPFQAGPLAVAGLYLLNARQTFRNEDKLLAYYWAGSLLPLLGLGKVGASQNYWIECAAITAALATLGIWSRLHEQSVDRRNRRAFVPLLLVGVSLAAVTPGLGASALPAFNAVSPNRGHAEALDKLIQRVRSEPGEVLAEPLDVVVLAGRRTLFEPTIFGILHSEGLWDAGPLVSQICAGEIDLLVLGDRLDSGLQQRHGYVHWPAPILAALQETMVLETLEAGRFIYVPSQRSPGVGC
jgi:hypothetical protein